MNATVQPDWAVQPNGERLYHFLESCNFSIDTSAPPMAQDQQNSQGDAGSSDRNGGSGDKYGTWISEKHSSHPTAVVPARAMSDVLHDRSIGPGFGKGFDDIIVDWLEDARRRSLPANSTADDRAVRPTRGRRDSSYTSAHPHQRRYSAARTYFRVLNGVKNRSSDRCTNEEPHLFKAGVMDGKYEALVSRSAQDAAWSRRSNPSDFHDVATASRLDERSYFVNESLKPNETPMLHTTTSTTDPSVVDLPPSFTLPSVQVVQDTSIGPSEKGEEDLFESLIQQQMSYFHFDTDQSNKDCRPNTGDDGVADPLSAFSMDKADDLLQWLGKQPGMQQPSVPTLLQTGQTTAPSAHQLKRQRTNSDYRRSSPDDSFLIQL